MSPPALASVQHCQEMEGGEKKFCLIAQQHSSASRDGKKKYMPSFIALQNE
jgi:hypothetical protein